MKISLYNIDGSLCSEAQFLINCKPDDISTGEWIKMQKKFRSRLSPDESRQFHKLRQRKHQAKYRKNNPAQIKQRSAAYHIKNLDRERKRSKDRYTSNPNYYKNYYDKNPEKVKQINLRWIVKNPEKVLHIQSNYRKNNSFNINQRLKNRKAVDPAYRFMCNIRVQCSRVVKKLALGKKPTSTYKWVGCSAEELKIYFESLFVEGMSWENYGKWHVDHIRPVSSFKIEEWEQVNHYSNLQPLWAKDNIKKSNKF